MAPETALGAPSLLWGRTSHLTASGSPIPAAPLLLSMSIVRVITILPLTQEPGIRGEGKREIWKIISHWI